MYSMERPNIQHNTVDCGCAQYACVCACVSTCIYMFLCLKVHLGVNECVHLEDKGQPQVSSFRCHLFMMPLSLSGLKLNK